MPWLAAARPPNERLEGLVHPVLAQAPLALVEVGLDLRAILWADLAVEELVEPQQRLGAVGPVALVAGGHDSGSRMTPRSSA